MSDKQIVIGDKVVLIDITDLDSGLKVGMEGYANATMNAEDADYVMFHPNGQLQFYWMAAWRLQKVED